MSVFCIFRRHSIASVRNRQISHHRNCPRQIKATPLYVAKSQTTTTIILKKNSSVQDRIRIAFNLTDFPLRLLLISNRINGGGGGGGGGDELNRVVQVCTGVYNHWVGTPSNY